MSRLVACAIVLAAAHAAHADDSFEAKAAGAQHVARIENLVWALTAPCDAGDDVQQRQCRHVRDTRAGELAGATLVVDGESDAFDVGAFSPQKKSVPLTLSACIRCSGVEIDGKTWYVVGNIQPSGFANGKPKVGTLHDNARTFPDEGAAKAWIKSMQSAKVQLIVKVPAKPKWTVDGKNGLALEILGYRVFTPCDGGIVCSSPKSGPAEADKKQCGVIAKDTVEPATEGGPKVEALTPTLIAEAMKPVVAQAQQCFEQYGVKGKAKLKITIMADGSVGKYEQQGDFASTPTGTCIDKAMTKAKFPASKKPKTSISFPLQLQ